MLPKKFFDVIIITKNEWKNFIDNHENIGSPAMLFRLLSHSNTEERLLFSKNRLHCGRTI